MSILTYRSPKHELQSESELLVPTVASIWTAGDSKPISQLSVARSQSPNFSTPVRSLHQGIHDGRSVQTYMEFTHVPLGLSSAAPAPTATAAIQELTQYASNLTQPMLCQRVNAENAAIGTETYESVHAFEPIASVENLARNMQRHGVCIKCTVSDPVLAFQPFTVKLTGEDLQNCIDHTQPILASGVESKFVRTVSQVAPHSVLFHIVKNPKTQQHHFYGINFTQKTTF